MRVLEAEGFAAIKRQAKRYLRGLTNEIKNHVTEELERHMATIHDALDRLSGAVANELQQVRDSLQGTIDNLSAENADLRNQLESNVSQLDSAITRVEGMSSELEANDPQPEQPAEPTEPTPEEPQP